MAGLDFRRVASRNISTFRSQPLAEISGALGDLGTLLPLLIALTVRGSVDLGASLVFGGAWNVATGVLFGVPLPVQPMKAIAAAAISRQESSSAAVVAGAGQLVAIALLIMSVTGVVRWCAAVVPVPIVKGIQLGAGLSLVMSAGSSLIGGLGWTYPALDNRLWALAAFCMLICTQQLSRFPYALAVFVVGLVLAFVSVAASDDQLPWLRIWVPQLDIPAWILGPVAPTVSMALGQLPLTTLNSVIAVSALSSELLPDVSAPSVTALGLSVAAMNLSGTWFDAMPVCHGSGGLAGQYRFGARSGASVIILGLFKIILGVFFGDTLLGLLRHYPKGILAVMVIAAGLELAKVGYTLNRGASDLWETVADSLGGGTQRTVSDKESMERWNVMLMTTAGILAFHNDALGLLAGLLCHASYRVSEAVSRESWFRRMTGERAPLLN